MQNQDKGKREKTLKETLLEGTPNIRAETTDVVLGKMKAAGRTLLRRAKDPFVVIPAALFAGTAALAVGVLDGAVGACYTGLMLAGVLICLVGGKRTNDERYLRFGVLAIASLAVAAPVKIVSSSLEDRLTNTVNRNALDAVLRGEKEVVFREKQSNWVAGGTFIATGMGTRFCQGETADGDRIMGVTLNGQDRVFIIGKADGKRTELPAEALQPSTFPMLGCKLVGPAHN